MTRLAIIHTIPATVDSLKTLAVELMPGCEVINFVDDSILPQLLHNGGNLSDVEERLVAYARFAQAAGAQIILEACSSVGELVEKMQAAVSIPVVRIDDAMAETAVQRAHFIGVAATLPTTLQPTARLLGQKAHSLGRVIELKSLLIEGAFECLSAGDRTGHDSLVAKALSGLAEKVELVVLAQASMARVVQQFALEEQSKFISSPRLGMERVKLVSDSLN